MSKLYAPIVGALTLMLLLATSAMGQNQVVDNAWKEFRNAHPYHIQCVGLTKPDEAGLRVVIIAEPPPHVTLESLKAVNPLILQNPKVRFQRIGYDGWVADVIFVLPAMSRDALKTILDQLNHHLYGTAYKASVLALPTQAILEEKRSLDLRVPAGELGEWVLGDLAHPKVSRSLPNLFGLITFGLFSLWTLRKIVKSGRTLRNLVMLATSCGALLLVWFGGPRSGDRKMLSFYSVLGGDKYTGREILESNRSGVFLSEAPGVVLWSFPRKRPLEANQIQAREFALDSDILIGAVASQDQLVILGRERSQPVDVLPPLRTETIIQLASAKTDELAQSYERTQVLAGKFDGKHDWAPIYLSRDLIDTEYGSLLNITDQILKSWSMHGLVRYVNFKYPDPKQFPFPTDLMRYAKTNQVTFNWNTKGVGYTTKNNTYEVFALHRTGALPVDYLSADNSELQKAEEDGYSYFASVDDPNLVRVVQYAALYQIFRRFSVTTSKGALVGQAASSAEPPESFRIPIASIVLRFAEMTDEDIERMRIKALNASDDSAELVKMVEAIKSFSKAIQELNETGDPGVLRRLVDAMAAPRDATRRFENLPSSEQTETEEKIIKLVQFSQKNREILQFLSRVNLAEVKDAYVSELTRRTPTWIRTPTIVLSWPEGENQQSLVGGHNLDAKITQFRFDTNLNSGEIRVIEENGQKIILHSAEDADKAPELVRLVARNEEKSTSELENILKNRLPEVQVPERTLDEALAFTADARPSKARGYQPREAEASVGSMGWKPTQDPIPQRQTDLLSALKSPKARTVVVSRQESGSYLVAHGSSKLVVESEDMPSAVDAAISCIKDETQGSSEVKLYLAGFEFKQGKGFAKSVEMNLTEEEFPKLTATIEGEPIGPEELSRLLSKEYKLEEAKITKLALADDHLSVDAELTVPSSEVARPSLIVRIKLWFKEGFVASSEVLGSIRNIIESWQSSLSMATEKLDIFLARKKLFHDLKSVHPEIRGIDVIYSRERKDLFYGASNQDPERDNRGSRQAV